MGAPCGLFVYPDDSYSHPTLLSFLTVGLWPADQKLLPSCLLVSSKEGQQDSDFSEIHEGPSLTISSSALCLRVTRYVHWFYLRVIINKFPDRTGLTQASAVVLLGVLFP